MSLIGRQAFRASRVLRAAGPTAGSITNAHKQDREETRQKVLAKGARRDPELYVRLPRSFGTHLRY
jgi:hypothetical protein